MADFKFQLDMDRTAVLELKLGTYIRGDRGQIGPQGEDGPPGTLTDDDQAALQHAIDTSGASAAAALQSQGAAAGSANAASSSAGQAASSATASGASAGQSAQSAGAAAQSASDAAAAQNNVAANANAATAAATAAQGSQTAAAGSATAAAGSQGAASTSASAASGSAAAASTSAIQAAQAALAYPYRNLFHNARLLMNQRIYASGTAAPTNIFYTVDRWRIYVAGQAATFTQNPGYTSVVCPAGGFEQVIDGVDVMGGQYVINWQGTATCQMGPVATPTTLVKGQVVTLTAGTSLQFRFSSGTLWLPQLEPGTIPTVFEVIPYAVEQERCSRYFRVVTIDHEGYQAGGQNAIWGYYFPFMRKVPVVSGLQRGGTPNYANITSPPTFWLSYDAVTCTVPVTTTGTWFVVGYALGLSADL